MLHTSIQCLRLARNFHLSQTYCMTPAEVATALRPFYFSVHPDLFGKYPNQRAINENSLKQLSSFLETLQTKKIAVPCNLQFYIRDKKYKDGTFRQVKLVLNERDLRAVVLKVLKSCDLATDFVDKIPKPQEYHHFSQHKTNDIDLSNLDPNDTIFGPLAIKRKIWDVQEELRLSGWIDNNFKDAIDKTTCNKPMHDEIEKMKEQLVQQWGILEVKWDCGWNETHLRGCLQSFSSLAYENAENMHILRGRILVFAPFTGVSLDGHIMLNSGEVRHNWLELIRNIRKYDAHLLRIPAFEKAVSQVLRDIKVVRRKFMPKILAGEYERNLQQITTSICDYLTYKNYPKTWPNSLKNFEIVIETEAGPIMVSPTGQFIVPASCPGFLLVSFLTDNMAEALESMDNYKRNKHVERNLHDECISQLNLLDLGKDDSVNPDFMIECCRKLLENKEKLKNFAGVRVNITTYYSVLSDGVINGIQSKVFKMNMELYEHIQIEEVCRLCLTKNEQMSLICEAGFADMLLECASIQITPENDCFNLVCSHCVSEVSRWFVFKQQVHRSFEIAQWLLERKAKIDIQVESPNIPLTDIRTLQIDDSSTHSNSIIEDSDKLESILEEYNIQVQTNAVAVDDKNGSGVTPRTPKKTKSAEELLCKKCGKQCTSTNSYNRHLKTHDDARPHVCSKCDKAFKTVQVLGEHMKRHYDDRRYKCEICHQKFYAKATLNDHMRSHTGERPYNCDICERSFSTRAILRQHLSVHTVREKKYQCEICSKYLLTSGSLELHKRKHTGIKPFLCTGCEKSFYTKEAMQRHFGAIHDKDNNFLCNVCSKICSTKVHLNNHMKKKHLGLGTPANALCNQCAKQCGSAAELKVHIRVHTGERPFICDICDKRFIAKGNLNAHKKRHAGKKPFLCDHCGKSFGEKSTLKVHERIHTGEHPFKCNICEKAYVQSSALRTHMKYHWKYN